MLVVSFLLAGFVFALAEENQHQDGLTDWLDMPSFSLEAVLGRGVDESGELTGEASSFPANVGIVFCRVAIIDADQPQTVTVVWYREEKEMARSSLRLSREQPHDTVRLNIPAVQSGSWRVEIVDQNDELLTVLPFLVGKPSPQEPPRKKKQPTNQ